MRDSPLFKIVWAHLTGRKRQTLVSILGVMFGITVFIFQAGMITGLQNYFIEKTINSTPHIQISNETNAPEKPIAAKAYKESNDIWFSIRNQKDREDRDRIKDGLQIAGVLEKHPDVYGVSPSLTSQAIFKLGVVDVSAIVYGVDIRKENRLFNLEKDIVQGSVIRLETVNNGLILGSGLAEKLGATLNDNLNIVSPNGVTLMMKVVGIISTGLKDLDDQRAYASLRNAQKLMKVQSSYITDINIKLKDIDKATALASEFEKRFGYKAEDWKERNASVFSVFKIQNIVTYLVIISIMLVSGFGIFNILTMMIYEKMTDIAILKAIGYTGKDIRLIFLSEALLIGFAGGLLGLALGFVISIIAASIPFEIEGFVTTERLNINFDPLFYAIAFFFGLLTTAVAGLLPARKAARVEKFHVLKDINIRVEEGEFVSIVGSSGSGKSTLLYTLSSLDTDYNGEVLIDKTVLRSLDNNQLARLRNRSIGFIFQSHYLLADFTAIDNIMLPGLKLGKLSKPDLLKAALEKLDLLDIRDQADKAVNTLSGGQQQRVAIARALINDPKIIFCDEPTGNLDSKNARIVFDLLKELAHRFNQTILMVTHDESYKTDRQIRLHDGMVV